MLANDHFLITPRWTDIRLFHTTVVVSSGHFEFSLSRESGEHRGVLNGSLPPMGSCLKGAEPFVWNAYLGSILLGTLH